MIHVRKLTSKKQEFFPGGKPFIGKSSVIVSSKDEVSLSCFLCEQYLNTPKNLLCKHTFCRSCLQQFCLNNATDTGFPCPRCRAMVKIKDPNLPLLEWADSLPTDHQLDKRLEKIRVLEQEKKKEKCAFCLSKWKAVVATKYCKSCQEYFCTECGNQHWLLRRSKEHRMWLIEDLITLKTDALLRAGLETVFNSKVWDKHITSVRDRRSQICTIDVAQTEITGATFLPNGFLVLADKANEKVKLFDDHFRFVTAYKTQCHDVLAFNNYFIVVTCPLDQCLMMLSIYNKEIELDKRISFEAECYGLCYIDDENNTNKFAVSLSTRPLQILHYSGLRLVEKIIVSPGTISMLCPTFLSFSKSKKLFFVSDKIHQCLKCITMEGSLLWEKRISDCRGITLFEDNLLLARSDRRTVDLANTSGQIIKSVVSAKEGLSRVHTLCSDHWNVTGNTQRVLVCDDTDLVRVYLVEDPLLDEDIRIYINKETSRSAGSEHDDKEEHRSNICVLI